MGVLLEKLDILVILHGVASGLNERNVRLQNRSNTDAYLFAEGLKIGLLLGPNQILILLPKITIFGHICDLFNEETKVHTRLLLK